MFESRSPLAGRLALGGRDGADGARALRFTEIGGRHLVQLGLFAGAAGEVSPLVRSITGAALPDSNREATDSGCHRLYRIAADQYWIASPDEGAGRALEQAVPSGAGTVTALSGARVCVRLEGRAACAVLSHHVAIDLDLKEFPIGCFAQTGIDHAGVLLDRRGGECFELYLLSTFAGSAWDLLVDTALPYGYSIGAESTAAGGPGSGPP
jgi:heterotetrameric sarcosine oxidase gamma subunit